MKEKNKHISNLWIGWILFCFSLFISHFSVAQQYSFITYNIEDGLAQSQVRCLFQDKSGYIWAGTLGGLSKFDGRTFTNYNRQNGLLNNQINHIIQLRDGSIVAASNGNINIIRGAQTRHILLPQPLSDTPVNILHQDIEGRLWLGTENGLFHWDGKQLSELQDLNKEHIKAIAERDGKMWILSKNALYSIESFTATHHYTANDGISFFDFLPIEGGQFYLATKGDGLALLELGKLNYQSISNALGYTGTTVTGIIADNKNNLWLTSRFGAMKYSNREFKFYGSSNGIPTEDIRDVLQDSEGNIWLASYGSGLLKFAGESFSTYTTKDNLSSNAIMSIAEDWQKNIWFSTFDRGICKKAGTQITQYDLKELTGNNRIWTSLCDLSGTMWFGSSDGLFSYDGNKFKQYTTADQLSDNMVLSLFIDRQNTLWIGTSKGLCKMIKGVIEAIGGENAPQRRIRAIKQDKGGNLWLAGIDGVYKYDGLNFFKYTTAQGLPENSAYCLEVDKDNNIWVGTQNGIAIKSGESFVSYKLDETSGSNVINFIKEQEGIMWIGTNNGVHCTAPGIGEKNFRRYAIEDGLPGLETNLNAVYTDGLNNLWFGTTAGVTVVNTKALQPFASLPTPSLVLEKIQINLLDQDWSKQPGIRTDSISGLPISPAFNYKNNHLTFHFAGISTTYPGNVEYRYKLVGWDEDWNGTSSYNFATYSNLPYTSYTFMVQARLKNGQWSEPISYAFSIRAPFWLRWWFILLEILTLLSLAGFIVSNRRKAQRAKREKESYEIKSKLLALEQQSLNSSMNRHFIFNALNSIQYYINRQDRLGANKYLTDFARLIRKNLDSSEDNLTSLSEEVERLELYLKLEHMRFKEKFEYQIHVAPGLNAHSIKIPAMLVQPFLENSIWHGLLPKESKGNVEVRIEQLHHQLHITITDDGIGIDNSKKTKPDTDSHISKGMEITQNRIELIKKSTSKSIELRGPQQIYDQNGHVKGTLVTIILPVDFDNINA